MQNGQFEGSIATVKRRSSNQRAWKLDKSIINSIMSNPEESLQNWTKACYEESLALEQEESLMRRIAAQCGIAIPEAPFRLGTRYLNPQEADQHHVDLDYESKSNNVGPKSFREGAVYTAAMLMERAKKNRKGKKISRMSLNGSLDGGFDENLAQRIPKKSDLMRFPAPLHLRQDYYTELKHETEGSLYASLNKELVHTANIVMPDLVIRTMEIPWKLVAKEFASIDNDSFESMVPIAQSPRNSDRMTANRVLNHRSSTDSYFNENSSIFKKASEVYAPSFKLTQPLELSEDANNNNDNDSEEDISDEAMLERHENVLKNMRDQWAMIKKLKKELKEINTPGVRIDSTENGEVIEKMPSVGRKRSRSANKINKPQKVSSGSLSPRRRGRPRKKNLTSDDKRDDDDQDNDDSSDENYQDG